MSRVLIKSKRPGILNYEICKIENQYFIYVKGQNTDEIQLTKDNFFETKEEAELAIRILDAAPIMYDLLKDMRIYFNLYFSSEMEKSKGEEFVFRYRKIMKFLRNG